MLSWCLSSLILRLVALVARCLKKPLHHYISFKKDRPFLTVGLTGRLGWLKYSWFSVSVWSIIKCVHAMEEFINSLPQLNTSKVLNVDELDVDELVASLQDSPSTLSNSDCCSKDG